MSVLSILILLIGSLWSSQAHGANPLGRGFNSETSTVRSACITATPMAIQDGFTSLTLDRQLSHDEMLTLVEGTFSGGINVGIASAKIENKISSTDFDREYSESFLYSAHYHLGQQTVNTTNPSYSEIGLDAIKTGDTEYIKAVCGNSFIDSVSLGGQVYIKVSFDFQSEESYRFIQTKITFKVLGIKKVKRFAKEIRDLEESVDIRIDAFQVGGDPQRLDQLLASLDRDQCNLDNLDHCEDILDRLLNYATLEDGFRSQLTNSVYKSTYKSYQNLGFEKLSINPYRPHRSYENHALLRLESRRQHEENVLARINDLIESHYIREKNKIPLYDRRLEAIALTKKVREAVHACRGNPELCVELSREVDLWPRSEMASLAQFKDFYFFCRKFSESGRGGILQILEKLQSENCDIAADRVSEISRLELDHAGLGNSVLIKFFTNLRFLSIRHNKMSSLAHLKGLTALNTLIADNNDFSDLQPLQDMSALHYLSLHKNQISRLPEFFWRLTGNHISLYKNNLPDTKEAENLAFDRIVLSLDDACDYETERAVGNGWVSEKEAELYRQVGFSYDYQTGAFINCLAAAESY